MERCVSCGSPNSFDTLQGEHCKECGQKWITEIENDGGVDRAMFREITVDLVRDTGDDLAIVQRAKQTYDSMPDEWEDSMEGILRYMMWYDHGTPFEEPDFSFKITLPIWAARQLVKYRMSTWNEYSRRYNDDELLFHDYRLRWDEGKGHKQGSGEIIHHQTEEGQYLYGRIDEFFELSRDLYNELIEKGVSPETARFVQPVGSMTSVTWKMNFRSLMNIMTQRLDYHAQSVTQDIVRKMADLIKHKVPVAYRAWQDKNHIFSRVQEVLYNYYKKGTSVSECVTEEIYHFFKDDDLKWEKRIVNYIEIYSRGEDRNKIIDDIIHDLKEMKI